MEIVIASRSQIVVRVDDKTATVSCEMLMPSPGMSDYLIYKDSLKSWDAPFDQEEIDQPTRDAIVQGICQSLTKIGRVPEIV